MSWDIVTALNEKSNYEMQSSRKAQIVYLKIDESTIKVFSKYSIFADFFSLKLTRKPAKDTRIYDYIIRLIDN